jgi:hypothetical protein
MKNTTVSVSDSGSSRRSFLKFATAGLVGAAGAATGCSAKDVAKNVSDAVNESGLVASVLFVANSSGTVSMFDKSANLTASSSSSYSAAITSGLISAGSYSWTARSSSGISRSGSVNISTSNRNPTVSVSF